MAFDSTQRVVCNQCTQTHRTYSQTVFSPMREFGTEESLFDISAQDRRNLIKAIKDKVCALARADYYQSLMALEHQKADSASDTIDSICEKYDLNPSRGDVMHLFNVLTDYIETSWGDELARGIELPNDIL